MIESSLLIATILFSFFQSKIFAQKVVISLYSGEIPNSKITLKGYQENLGTNRLFTKISIQTLTVFTPPKGTENGTAVIILPSGVYRVFVDEGEDFAKAFARNGITAFVLKYRLPSDEIMKDKSTGPLQDAQMAIKLVRMNAGKYDLDTNKIGFVGVSAGGHLATTEATHLDAVLIDNKEKINPCPDFMILLYPVISFTQCKVNATKARLLGESPSEDSLIFFSCEKQVIINTPPTFLLHAGDDARVSVQHSILFYEALKKANVKSELHIFQNEGHGFALDHDTRGNKWFSWCIDWLNDNQFGIQKNDKSSKFAML